MFDRWRNRWFPETAVCLHIFYPAIGLEILSKLKTVSAPFTLIVSHSHPLPDTLLEILAEIKKKRPVEIHHESNIGFDVLPFLYLLPRLKRFEVVCKLHTKRNYADSGSFWRDHLIETLIGNDRAFRKIVRYLDSHHTIGMLGPAELYMSSRYLSENDERDMDALLTAFAPDMIGSEWGYFAGGMFWARIETLSPVCNLASDLEEAWRYEDREIARAVEPIFGLLPAMQNRKVAVLEPTTNGLEMRELDDMDDPKRNFIGPHLLEVYKKRQGQVSMKSVRELALLTGPNSAADRTAAPLGKQTRGEDTLLRSKS